MSDPQNPSDHTAAKLALVLALAAQHHRASIRAMVAVEIKVRKALRDAVQVAGASPNVFAASHKLAADAADILLRGRTLARSASHASMLRELGHAKAQAAKEVEIQPGDGTAIATAQQQTALDRVSVSRTDSVHEDATQAQASARSLATAFAVAALAADQQEADAPAEEAAKKVRGKADLIAATEVSQAFNHERERSSNVAAAVLGLAAVLPMKRWDATLDRFTCSRCKKLDGELRAWGVAFTGGAVPGKVHPRCRCVQTTIFLPAMRLAA